MDTIVNIKAVSSSKKDAYKAIDSAFALLDRLSAQLNFYSPDSEVSMLNKNAGVKETVLSSDTFDVIEAAVEVSKLSVGAYDPTIGAVSRLWDFPNAIKPDDKDISENLPLVDYRDVELNSTRNTVMLKKKACTLILAV
ncbi:ApbE-like lipoprotein [Candidatus Magnetoovum chiemensis]|nr:ApbE-like lipoprotein [Candidatus Magnetoovum chiemensis]